MITFACNLINYSIYFIFRFGRSVDEQTSENVLPELSSNNRDHLLNSDPSTTHMKEENNKKIEQNTDIQSQPHALTRHRRAASPEIMLYPQGLNNDFLFNQQNPLPASFVVDKKSLGRNRSFLRYGRDPMDRHFLRFGKRGLEEEEDVYDDIPSREVRGKFNKNFVRFG